MNTVAEHPPADARIFFGTFGIYRYTLAILVLVTHGAPMQWNLVGMYAVFAFYVLSGYVVCFMLHNQYLPLRHGVWKYAANRVLRIFPMYAVVLLAALILAKQFPDAARELDMSYPETAWQWFANLSTFGIKHPVFGSPMAVTVVPVAWALSVEITYWALMPLMLTSKSSRWLMMCFVGIYLAATLANTWDGEDKVVMAIRYFSALAAMLPFYIGLMLFIRKLHRGFVIPRVVGVMAMLAFAAILAATPTLFAKPVGIGFYLALLANTLIVAYLSQLDSSLLPAWSRRIDKVCGNIAYPVYLVHMPLGMALHASLPEVPL